LSINGFVAIFLAKPGKCYKKTLYLLGGYEEFHFILGIGIRFAPYKGKRDFSRFQLPLFL